MNLSLLALAVSAPEGLGGLRDFRGQARSARAIAMTGLEASGEVEALVPRLFPRVKMFEVVRGSAWAH